MTEVEQWLLGRLKNIEDNYVLWYGSHKDPYWMMIPFTVLAPVYGVFACYYMMLHGRVLDDEEAFTNRN